MPFGPKTVVYVHELPGPIVPTGNFKIVMGGGGGGGMCIRGGE